MGWIIKGTIPIVPPFSLWQQCSGHFTNTYILVTSPHRRQYVEVSFRSLHSVVTCSVFLDTPLKKSWVVLLKNAGGDVDKTTIYTALREVFEPLLEVYVYITVYIYIYIYIFFVLHLQIYGFVGLWNRKLPNTPKRCNMFHCDLCDLQITQRRQCSIKVFKQMPAYDAMRKKVRDDP